MVVAAMINQAGLKFGTSYIASQGRALGRNGPVYVRYEGELIYIGGQARTCLSGTLVAEE